MARRRGSTAERRGEGDEAGEQRGSTLLVPVWLGLFLGSWWAIDRLLLLVARALRGGGSAGAAAGALAGAREVVAPILGLLLGAYAIALLGALRRRARGEPWSCETPEEPERPDPVASRLRDGAAVDRVALELDRARRAERGVLRRAVLSVNDRLMVGALRRRGYNDDMGCGAIVLILVGATVALPFAAQLISSLTGLAPVGPLGVLLWFGLAYGGFCVRWLWKWSRDASR